LGQSLEAQGGINQIGQNMPPPGLPEDPRILMGLMTPEQMPNLSRAPFNFDAFNQAQAGFPESTNVEDRRYMGSSINPFTSAAAPVYLPGKGMVTGTEAGRLYEEELSKIRGGPRQTYEENLETIRTGKPSRKGK
jgi:hypothetical protein